MVGSMDSTVNLTNIEISKEEINMNRSDLVDVAKEMAKVHKGVNIKDRNYKPIKDSLSKGSERLSARESARKYSKVSDR